MGILSGEKLTKVTLFLYTKDLEELRRKEGYGWSTKVRLLVRAYLKAKQTQDFRVE
jgi:hypothetical protein